MIYFLHIEGVWTIFLPWTMFRKEERWFNVDRR